MLRRLSPTGQTKREEDILIPSRDKMAIRKEPAFKNLVEGRDTLYGVTGMDVQRVFPNTLPGDCRDLRLRMAEVLDLRARVKALETNLDKSRQRAGAEPTFVLKKTLVSSERRP